MVNVDDTDDRQRLRCHVIKVEKLCSKVIKGYSNHYKENNNCPNQSNAWMRSSFYSISVKSADVLNTVWIKRRMSNWARVIKSLTAMNNQIPTRMDHHWCFRVYVTRTRATRISDTIVFKHQYITSPTILPESHVVAAAQQLVTALQGNIPVGSETAEALTKVSKLYTKIALAKKEVSKAKEQRNSLRANPSAWITTHLPRVAVPPARVDVPVSRVTKATQADCHVAQTGMSMTMMRPPVQTLTTRSSRPPRADARPPLSRPNYILQDKVDGNAIPHLSNKPQGLQHGA
jgi:hypothetical protein